MVMVRRAADHGIQVFLVQAFAPVTILLRLGKFLSRGGKRLGVDVTKSDDVLLFEHPKMRGSSSPAADECDIEPVSRTILHEQRTTGKKQEAGAGGGGGSKKFTSISSRTKELLDSGKLGKLTGLTTSGLDSWQTDFLFSCFTIRPLSHFVAVASAVCPLTSSGLRRHHHPIPCRPFCILPRRYIGMGICSEYRREDNC